MIIHYKLYIEPINYALHCHHTQVVDSTGPPLDEGPSEKSPAASQYRAVFAARLDIYKSISRQNC